jgi:hypothetical protein
LTSNTASKSSTLPEAIGNELHDAGAVDDDADLAVGFLRLVE